MREHNNNAVSEIISTMLLLMIAVSIFSVVYLIFIPQEPHPNVEIKIVGTITTEGNIIFEHHGGQSLPLDTEITVIVGGDEITFLVSENLSSTYAENNLWDPGERVIIQLEESQKYQKIEAKIVDLDMNTMIWNGVLTDYNIKPNAVDDIVYTHVNTPKTIDIIGNDNDVNSDTLYLDSFDITTFRGGTVSRDNSGTPDNYADDNLYYIPPSGFDSNSFWCCFPAGTKITMADNKYKNIEDIKIGDFVKSFNIQKNLEIKNGVTNKIVKLREGVYSINDGLISPTDDHPLFVRKPDGRTVWAAINPEKSRVIYSNRNAVKLEVGDEVFTQNGEWIKIYKIKFIPGEIFTYTITVNSDAHNYFANGLLVSNSVACLHPDYFNYIISDGHGCFDMGNVSVYVMNRKPVAINDSSTVLKNSNNNTIDVLGNDHDPDGDSLTINLIYSGPSNGTALLSNGSIFYTPNPGFNGTDSFRYRCADPEGSYDTAMVYIDVVPRFAVNDVVATHADMDIYSADLDSDGDIDIVGAKGTGPNGTEWYENLGNGTFITHTLAGNQVCGVHAEDINQDGLMDILSADRHEALRWFENIGGGVFITHELPNSSGDSWSIYANDIDSDGDMDIVSGTKHNRIWWFENDGTESFTKHVVAYDGVHDIEAHDMDNDGDIDIINADYVHDHVSWYENDGTQNFTTHHLATVEKAYRLQVNDIDQDGLLDIIATRYDGWNTNNGRVLWFENNGPAGGPISFNVNTIKSGLNGAEGVYSTDMDNDGDIDILSTEYCTNYEINWYENDGNQTFTTHEIRSGLGEGKPVSVHAADYDLDGDTDVAASFYITQGIIIYKNNII